LTGFYHFLLGFWLFLKAKFKIAEMGEMIMIANYT